MRGGVKFIWTRPLAFNRSAAGSDRAFRVLTPPAAGDNSTSDLSPHLHAFPVPCAASTADSSSRKRRGWRNAPPVPKNSRTAGALLSPRARALELFFFSVLAIPHLTFWSMEAPQVAADDASNRSPYSVWCYGNRLQVTAAMTAMDDPPSMFPMIHVWFSLDLDEQVLVFISDSDVLYYRTPPRSGG